LPTALVNDVLSIIGELHKASSTKNSSIKN
jgi:hypothetical protein